MTDEQNPGDQPQDPTQPMASGQQPPADAPPPPPVNPYEQQPPAPDPAAPAPPYGEPTPPPYGQAAPPPYGQQQPAPAYGQPAMAAGYPGATEPKASRAMAITALVLSLVICIPFVLALVAIILGVVVLVARKPGKGLAITAIVISLLASAAWIGLFVAIGSGALDDVFDDLLPVEQLKTGECLNASNLTDDDEDFVEDIDEVSCDDPHDAEVLVTKELTQDDAETYDAESSSLCTDLITDGGLSGKIGPDVGYFGLTTEAEPNAGDKLVCIAYRLDGSKLDAPL